MISDSSPQISGVRSCSTQSVAVGCEPQGSIRARSRRGTCLYAIFPFRRLAVRLSVSRANRHAENSYIFQFHSFIVWLSFYFRTAVPLHNSPQRCKRFLTLPNNPFPFRLLCRSLAFSCRPYAACQRVIQENSFPSSPLRFFRSFSRPVVSSARQSATSSFRLIRSLTIR